MKDQQSLQESNIIVSTQGCTQKLSFLSFIYFIFGPLGGIALLFLARSAYGDERKFIFLLGAIFIAMGFLVPCSIHIIKKSYCKVTEKGVEGVALQGLERFQLTYTEIQNATETNMFIILYTTSSSYKVLALRNRTAALEAIRVRLSAKKKT